MASSSISSRLALVGGPRGALAATALLLALGAMDSSPQRWLREQLFDAYQRVLPRQRVSAPATIVEIDERSLATIGQWPWPRTRLAELVDRVAVAHPAAIGIDLLLPEPDRLSPRRILEAVPDLDPSLSSRIGTLPDNDAVLAAALKGRPVAIGMAGDDSASAPGPSRPLHTVPVLVRGDAAGLEAVPAYGGAVRSRPEMEAAAAGEGLLNSGAEGGVVRSVPLMGRVGPVLVPNLEMEMLRIAAGAPAVEVVARHEGVSAVRVADVNIPTTLSGEVWLRYGLPDGARVVSAADVLRNAADRALLEHKLVLIGLTGLGLVDQPPTPLGVRLPGVEIRAQLLENVFDHSWLAYPAWARLVEAFLFVGAALLFVRRVPRGSPWDAFGLFAAVAAALGVCGLVAFNFGLLLDVATPGAAAAIVFTLVLGGTLAEAQRQRRELSRHLAQEREQAARLEGEMDTARRVQVGMLPDPSTIGDPRVELSAFMEPARSVGGDLYDFFMLDERTLFVMIGDVSGKGLGAAMFMALIRSLCKSAVLRQPRSLEKALAQAEEEIRRENPESLFVTLLALSLDLETGEIAYCNAGHDPIYGLSPGRLAPRKLDQGGRPPLCVLEGYPYPLCRDRLEPGETLCLITDGITEAENPFCKLYGHPRLEAVLSRMRAAGPQALVEEVRRDVARFASGAEQADDMSVVALRWTGPLAVGVALAT